MSSHNYQNILSDKLRRFILFTVIIMFEEWFNLTLNSLATKCCLCTTQWIENSEGLSFFRQDTTPLYFPIIIGAPYVAIATKCSSEILFNSK